MPIKQHSVVGRFDDVLVRLIKRLGEGNVYRTYEDDIIVLVTDRERFWMRANS
jgi:hypothetical protein